jgi:hypothetical protein
LGDSSVDEIDELDELEYVDDEDDDAVAKHRPTVHHLINKKQGKGKLVPFDPVNIPKGDKTSFEKFISWRLNDAKEEELLVKYKVA